MDLLKQIAIFVFNIVMLLFAVYIIASGAKSLNIGVFAFIPFIYLFCFFTKDTIKK